MSRISIWCADSPALPCTCLRHWLQKNSDHGRRAGVSAFGIFTRTGTRYKSEPVRSAAPAACIPIASQPALIASTGIHHQHRKPPPRPTPGLTSTLKSTASRSQRRDIRLSFLIPQVRWRRRTASGGLYSVERSVCEHSVTPRGTNLVSVKPSKVHFLLVLFFDPTNSAAPLGPRVGFEFKVLTVSTKPGQSRPSLFVLSGVETWPVRGMCSCKCSAMRLAGGYRKFPPSRLPSGPPSVQPLGNQPTSSVPCGW